MWTAVAEQLLAQRRVDAVGADHDVGAEPRAVGQMQRDTLGRLGKGGSPRAEPDGHRVVAQDRLGQGAMEIAAVHHPVGCAIMLDRAGAEVEQIPGLARAEQPDFLAGRLGHDAPHDVVEPERDQHPRPVGAELQAGAELAKLGCLLDDADIEAAPPARQRGDQPGDAGASDQNVLDCHATCGADPNEGSRLGYDYRKIRRMNRGFGARQRPRRLERRKVEVPAGAS